MRIGITPVLLAFATVFGVVPGCAASWELSSICVTESVPLDRHTRTAFEKELLVLLRDRHVTFDCAARDAIRLNILSSAPRLHGYALGIARKTAGRILPDLELYVKPVILRLGHLRVSGVVGRTLARIAAHEMVHYLDQRHDHDEAGILQPSFTIAQIAQLAGYDSESLMRAQGQKRQKTTAP